MDEELNALYKDESKFSRLSIILTILAIVIACLGLIGLTSFMVERKTKGLSVRRVHGSTVSDVNTLICSGLYLSALVTLLITLLVTSIHAYRASLNPAKTLKYE